MAAPRYVHDERHERRLHAGPIDSVQSGQERRQLPLVGARVDEGPPESGRLNLLDDQRLPGAHHHHRLRDPRVAQGVQDGANERPLPGLQEGLRAPHPGRGPGGEDDGGGHFRSILHGGQNGRIC